MHYSEKQEYINLAKNFLNSEIPAEDFSSSFLAMDERISKEINKIKREESPKLFHFLKITNYDGLNRFLASLHGSCESFSTDPELTFYDEKELKNYAQIFKFFWVANLIKSNRRSF